MWFYRGLACNFTISGLCFQQSTMRDTEFKFSDAPSYFLRDCHEMNQLLLLNLAKLKDFKVACIHEMIY